MVLFLMVLDLLCLVNRMSAQHSPEYLGLVNLLDWNLENILIDHDKIGGLTGFDGARLAFLLHGHNN